MTQQAFAPLTGALGFSPVVPDADWVQRLLDWGVRTIQLRYKPPTNDAEVFAQQVRMAVAAGRAVARAQVFINGSWPWQKALMACI